MTPHSVLLTRRQQRYDQPKTKFLNFFSDEFIRCWVLVGARQQDAEHVLRVGTKDFYPAVKLDCSDFRPEIQQTHFENLAS